MCPLAYFGLCFFLFRFMDMGSPCLLGEIQFHAFRCPEQMRFQACRGQAVLAVIVTVEILLMFERVLL